MYLLNIVGSLGLPRRGSKYYTDSILPGIVGFPCLKCNLSKCKNGKTNYVVLHMRQATIQGFEAKGLSREESEALLRRSVEIANEAKDIYSESCTKDAMDFSENERASRRPILVAASIGSYGAYLADGSEYR